VSLLEDDALVDAIASVEHDQWIEWAVDVMEEVEPERKARWQRSYFVPYESLPEAAKELDRVYARRVLAEVQMYYNERGKNPLTDGEAT
jgi:hypothetical protein